MKSLLRLAAFCLLASLAHADLVVEQKMESSVINGVVTMKVKGNRARVEAPTPVGQTISLLDLDGGKMTMLMPGQKMAMEMDLNAVKKQADAALKASGADPASAKPVPTGAKKKIGEWDAEEYTATSQGIKMHFWIAPKFPNGREMAKELGKISAAMAPGTPDPSTFNLPGMVVQSEVDTQVGKITSTLQSAKQTTLAADEFTVPAGYQVMPMPGALGAPK